METYGWVVTYNGKKYFVPATDGEAAKRAVAKFLEHTAVRADVLEGSVALPVKVLITLEGGLVVEQ